MKIIRERVVKGRRQVTVELDQQEEVVAVRAGCMYRLGGQLDEVVPSHVIEEMAETAWCHISQKWIE